MKERNKFTVIALVVLLVGSYGTGGLDISRDEVVDLVEDAVGDCHFDVATDYEPVPRPKKNSTPINVDNDPEHRQGTYPISPPPSWKKQPVKSPIQSVVNNELPILKDRGIQSLERDDPIPHAIYTVEGIFRFEDREQDETGFTGVNPLMPVRFADVEVYDVNTQEILGSGFTDFVGYFLITVDDSVIRDIAIRAVTTSINDPNLFNHSVTQLPSAGGNPYTVSTPTYVNHPLSNIDFTGSPVNAMSGGAGNAFHLFDNEESAERYVENLTSAQPRVNLTIYWTVGVDEGKFYDTNGHVFLPGTSSDDDSYDDNVILHEIGHYIALSYSTDASFYGAHSLSGNYDIRLSFSEGLGSYFMGAIRNYLGVPQPLIYIETNGVGLNWFGYSMSYDTDTPSGYGDAPLPLESRNAENEVTIGHAIFDIVDGIGSNDGSPGVDDDLLDLPGMQGDQLVWGVLISIDENATGFTKEITMEVFVDTFRIIHPGYDAALTGILANVGIEYFDDAYEDDDTYLTAKPKLPTSQLYHHTYWSAGDEDWSSFDLLAGADYVFKTQDLLDGADTILELYDTDGTSLLDTNNDRDGTTKASLIRYVAVVTGLYFIKSYRYLETPTPVGEYGKYNLTAYIVNNPKILSVIPNTGPVPGGTSVDITGENFTVGATVLFGVYEATGVVLVGNTFTVTTPANVPGLADVTVLNPPTVDGIIPLGTMVDGFTYIGTPLAPVVREVAPPFGSSSTTNNVTVEGDYFIDGVSLYFNAVEVMSYLVIDAKTISATLQPLPVDIYDVNVTNPDLQYDVLEDGYESTLQSFNIMDQFFDYINPLVTTIDIPENFMISDLYVFVNLTHPDGREPVIELESPIGTVAKVYDDISVVDENEQWRMSFSKWFGYEEAPSEGLYQYKGESTQGTWTLRLSSTTSTDSTLHSWGICFLQYRHRNISRIVYTPGEFRNYLLAIDENSDEQLWRAKLGSNPASTTVSADQTRAYAGTYSYHNDTTGGYTDCLVNCYDSFTGKKLASIILEGNMGRGGLAAIPNSNKIVATTTHHLYVINTDTHVIEGSVDTPMFNTMTVNVGVTPDGLKAYLAGRGALNYVQIVDLPGLTLAGQIPTPGREPRHVDISNDGNTGVIVFTDDEIDVFNPATDVVSKTVFMSSYGYIVSLVPGGSKAYFATFQWYAGFGIVNLTTEVSQQIEDPTDSTTCGVKVSHDHVAYISDWYLGTIHRYDAITDTKIGELDTQDSMSIYPTSVDYADMVDPPFNLAANVVASGNISLTWDAPQSLGSPISHYKIYRGSSSGREVFYRTTTSDQTTFFDYNITGGEYYYRVNAVNEAGEGGLSSEASATSLAPLITIDYPSTPDIIESGIVAISWTVTDNDPFPNGGNIINLSYSDDGGLSWNPLGSDMGVDSDPYIWDAGLLSDGVNYLIRATAYDATNQLGTGYSSTPFSIDNIPDDRWHFQVQPSGANLALDMRPVEPINTEMITDIDSAGEFSLGKWESRSFPGGIDIAGQWNFSAWGYTSIGGVTNGFLKAKIYTSSNPIPVYTSISDDEDIDGFIGAYHEFYWQDIGVSGIIELGDSIIIELALDASSGVPTSYSFDNTTSDIPGNGTVTGTHANTQSSDDVYQVIEEIPSGPVVLLYENWDASPFPQPPWDVFHGHPSADWSRNGGSSAGGTPPQVACSRSDPGVISVWRLYAGPIDTSLYNGLTLWWNNYFNDWLSSPPVCQIKVQTSSDGNTWQDTSWLYFSDGGDIGPAPETFQIATSDVGSSTFYFSFTVEGDSSHINFWNIDDILLTGLSSSALDHKWEIDVSGSATNVEFNIEANTTGEPMSLYYSATGTGPVGGAGWDHMLDITKTADDDTVQSFAMPVSTIGTVYIGAIDTDRAPGDNTLDTLFIDRMYISSETAAPRFIFGYDHGLTQSYVEPALVPLPVTYNITISDTGWQFVSFPIDVSGPAEAVFNDSNWGDGGTTWDFVQWYDPRDPADPWKTFAPFKPPNLNDMPVVNNTISVWIHITGNGGDGNLTVGSGVYPISTGITLYAGWNMVGYPSQTEKSISDALVGTGYDRPVEGFNATAPYHISPLTDTYMMQPGEGYWVHVPADTVWVVDW